MKLFNKFAADAATYSSHWLDIVLITQFGQIHSFWISILAIPNSLTHILTRNYPN